MNRNLLFWAICLLLSVALLRVEPAMAGTTDNCTSAQLPLNGVLNTEVTRTLPVGSEIPGSDSMTVVNINCNANWSSDKAYCVGGGGWSVNPTGDQIPMETNIPGVYTYAGFPSGMGYQLLNGSGDVLPLDSTSRHNTGVMIRTGDQSIPLDFRMVKISNALTSVNTTISFYLSCNGTEWGNVDRSGSIITMSVNSTAITQTCQMINADTLVQLPKVARSAFKGVGSSAGATPFTLDFQCDAGADARFNITDVTQENNASDALGLLGDSTASGLGVRLLHEGSTVHLASSHMFDQGESDFPLLNLEDNETTISVPFAAEYLQTQDSVTAGTVQAQAVVTIDYN